MISHEERKSDIISYVRKERMIHIQGREKDKRERCVSARMRERKKNFNNNEKKMYIYI